MIFTRKQVKRFKFSLLIAGFVFLIQIGTPHVSLAAEANSDSLAQGGQAVFTNNLLAPELIIDNQETIFDRQEKLFTPVSEAGLTFLPVEQSPSVISTHYVPVTAYSSEPRQTDSTPFTTAWQTPVRDGVVAANFLPLGSLVRFPDQWGDKIFVVEDRMNARYSYRVDIWMYHTSDARTFGLRHLRMEVLGPQLDREYVLTHYDPAFPGRR